jgi:hypothetical protein
MLYKRDELFSSDVQLLGRVTYEGFAKAWPTFCLCAILCTRDACSNQVLVCSLLLTSILRTRFLKRRTCNQRSHAWRCAELYHLPEKQTRLLHPRLQIGQGMDLSLPRAQGQVQRVDGSCPFSCRCPIAEHLDDHQVSPTDQRGSDPANEGGRPIWWLEM